MAGMNVKKGDTVRVISGKDRGLRAGSSRPIPEPRQGPGRGRQPDQEAHQDHDRPTRGAQQGGIVTQEAPVHVSNVQVVCPDCGKPTRIGHREDEAAADAQRPASARAAARDI